MCIGALCPRTTFMHTKHRSYSASMACSTLTCTQFGCLQDTAQLERTADYNKCWLLGVLVLSDMDGTRILISHQTQACAAAMHRISAGCCSMSGRGQHKMAQRSWESTCRRA